MRYPIEKFFDNLGMIGNYVDHGTKDADSYEPIGPDGWVDGGDTTQRMGMYHIGLWASRIEGIDVSQFPQNDPAFYASAASKLYCQDTGFFKRHPDPKQWYSECRRGSRDQTFPMVAAMGAVGDKFWLKMIFYKHLFRRLLMFTTNTRRNGSTEKTHGRKASWAEPLKWYHKLVLKYRIPMFPTPKGHTNFNWKLPDLTMFSFWALYIRGWNPKNPVVRFLALIVLNFLDLEFLVNAILKRTLVKEDSDIVNHCVEAVYAHYRMPSLVSRFTNAKVNSSADMIRKLRDYFDYNEEFSRSPWFIGVLYEPIILKVMGK